MLAGADEKALAALLRKPPGVYDCAERFHLPLAVVLGFVRGVLAVRPDTTPAELVEAAGNAGIPRSVLLRAARGEPPTPAAPPPSAYSRRTRLSQCLW
jgi:hypothetical protein